MYFLTLLGVPHIQGKQVPFTPLKKNRWYPYPMWLGTIYSTVGVPTTWGGVHPTPWWGYPTTWNVFPNPTRGSTYPIGKKVPFTPLEKNRWYPLPHGVGYTLLHGGGTLPHGVGYTLLHGGGTYHMGWGTPYSMVGYPTTWGGVHPTPWWGYFTTWGGVHPTLW